MTSAARSPSPPLRASLDELAGLPPAFVVVDENHVLRDVGEAYARKLTEAGIQTTAVRYGILHDSTEGEPGAQSRSGHRRRRTGNPHTAKGARSMKITVVGASGLIGAKVVDILTAGGHDVVAASRDSGADVITGEGLADALAGADVLVDVVNSPSFEDDPVLEVLHHVHHEPGGRREGCRCRPLRGAVDRRRRRAARQRIHAGQGRSGEADHRVRPALLHRARDAVRRIHDAIVASATEGTTVRVPDALIQPIAADDCCRRGGPRRGRRTAERHPQIGGPDKISFDDLARAVLAKRGEDKTVVVVDPEARLLRHAATTAQPGHRRLARSSP